MDLQHMLDAPYEAALAAKGGGAKIVGVVSNNIPVEIIHAAGLFSLQVAPRPGPTPRADEFMESLFDPMLRSVFDQLLGGELDFLDAVVLPRSVDSMQRAYYYLCELKRVGRYRGPTPLLYDLQKLPNASSDAYTLERTREFAAAMETMSGQTIGAGALAQSIRAYNGLREDLAKLGEARGRLSGSAALAAMAIAPTLAPEAAEKLVREVVRAERSGSGAKLILIGSAHAAPDLHDLVARAGGNVVGDFHWRGDLFYGPPIALEGDPLVNIAQHYARGSYSSRDYPSPLQAIVDFARARDAAGAIFFYHREEEAMVWDYPAQSKALEAAGVRTLLLSQQSYPVDPSIAETLVKFIGGAPR